MRRQHACHARPPERDEEEEEDIEDSEDAAAAACPWCGRTPADLEHCVWACVERPPPVQPPEDHLQRRLGWPRYAKPSPYDRKVLRHMAGVRQELIHLRRGRQDPQAA